MFQLQSHDKEDVLTRQRVHRFRTVMLDQNERGELIAGKSFNFLVEPKNDI